MSPYHHGNLHEALIETGIQYVNDNGEASLSLRKICEACGVSHAAAYSHFADKKALLDAMRDHITAQFTKNLEETALRHKSQPDMVARLGVCYVEFFAENPHYYMFLFRREEATEIVVNLDDLEFTGNYPPFELFKTISVAVFAALGLPAEKHAQTLLAMWAVVHGLAAISAMDAVRYSGDWGALTARILAENITIDNMDHGEISNRLSKIYREDSNA